ncbi:MAG: DUF4190 domain-containing protein [Planctomycetaceae bacterium]
MSVLTSCPNCKAELATVGHDESTLARCAKCGAQFPLDASLFDLPTKNTKATVSAVLGCCSVLGLFFTGIPAVILGWLALKAIREKKTQGGRSLAITGMATGGVFSLLCGGGAIGLAAFAFSVLPSEDPADIAKSQRVIGTFDLPEQVEPKFASNVLGMTNVAYGDPRRKTRIMSAFYPPAFAMNAPAAMSQAQSMKIQLSLSKHATHELNGHAGPIEVLEEHGKDDDGDSLRVFSGPVAHNEGWVVFQIRVYDDEGEEADPEDSEKEPAYYISRQEIDQIFESFRPPAK